jgi:hypothetical protein
MVILNFQYSVGKRIMWVLHVHELNVVFDPLNLWENNAWEVKECSDNWIFNWDSVINIKVDSVLTIGNVLMIAVEHMVMFTFIAHSLNPNVSSQIAATR